LLEALAPEQKNVALAPVDDPRTTFLEGPAGCGKTTTAVQRLQYLLGVGVPPDSMLVWVPQRSLARPFIEALRQPDAPSGTHVQVLSIDGLARRMIELFWPTIAAQAGFDPLCEPTFLTLETAQYYMGEVVQPLVDEGMFGDVTVPPNRLLSQIIDNLNKAALVGFAHTEIAERLGAAWGGPSSRLRVYEAVERAGDVFRTYCLQHNLLDFSLQLDTFMRHAWTRTECRQYLLRRYRYVIADNVEEDVPVAHDLLSEWLTEAVSALVVMDHSGGLRTYLGADPKGAARLADLCDHRVLLEHTFVSSPAVVALAQGLLGHNASQGPTATAELPSEAQIDTALDVLQDHYHTGAVHQVVEEVVRLTQENGVPPTQIAIVAPFVDDALRFALLSGLETSGVPVRTHRPSRALREEPAVRCLLTLAALAHPHWEVCPPAEDVAQSLVQAIGGMDWVRGRLLADIVYRTQDGSPNLSAFSRLNPGTQDRVTFLLGGRYSSLLNWLEQYVAEPPMYLDLFFSRLFDEVLARPGYGFRDDYDAPSAAAVLVESVSKFRQVLALDDVNEVGKRYLRLVNSGVLAAQYLSRPTASDREAVFVGPAYSFLTANQVVGFQFWLNANSPSWGRRLYQPLTHPFVLTRHWPKDRVWTEDNEYLVGQEMLSRVLTGLLRRCRVKVYMVMSELNARGREERGPLLRWVQGLLRDVRRTGSKGRV
jgi:hypothetical protein